MDVETEQDAVNALSSAGSDGEMVISQWVSWITEGKKEDQPLASTVFALKLW